MLFAFLMCRHYHDFLVNRAYLVTSLIALTANKGSTITPLPACHNSALMTAKIEVDTSLTAVTIAVAAFPAVPEVY